MSSLNKAAKTFIKEAAKFHSLLPKHVLWLHTQCSERYDTFAPFAFAALLSSVMTFKDSWIKQNIVSMQDLNMQKTALIGMLLKGIPSTKYLFLYDFIARYYVKESTLFASGELHPLSYPSISELNQIALEDMQQRSQPVVLKEDPEAESTIAKLFRDIDKPKEAVTPPSEFEAVEKPKPVVTSRSKDWKWSTEQQGAINKVQAWLRSAKRANVFNSKAKQVFRLFGYAGTGKTTLALDIHDFVKNEQGSSGSVRTGEVLFAAYTGQAASIMRKKGMTTATTIHSLIYKPRINANTGKIDGFVLNRDSPLRHASLLILDECSMVDEELALDLLSFGCLILVLGDPEQIPPVKGEGYFTNAEPDVMLTDVRRQAKDNPIIYLATRARLKKSLKVGHYGESRILDANHLVSGKMLMEHDMIIAGLNRTRQSINTRVRKLNGKYDIDPTFPVKGDMLICLKNNQDKTLLNGTTWTCNTPKRKAVLLKDRDGKPYKGDLEVLSFRVRSVDTYDEEGNLAIYDTQCPLHLFDRSLPEPSWHQIRGADAFDFGYARTCHKAQGSQADHVLVFDESAVFGVDAHRWRYTALTRAAETVTMRL